MAVYLDYTLKPTGRSLLTSPDVMQDSKDSTRMLRESSPVMDRAPLLLQESLLFPYRDGLGFEQRLLKDKGPQYAFAGVLDRPPSTSYEIMNPRAYERSCHRSSVAHARCARRCLTPTTTLMTSA